jgi:hypothetical protein
MQAELTELVDGKILTFPLKKGALNELLMKICLRSK